MKREQLTVQTRSALGKKVKKIRREGILPANVYGPDIKSAAVQLSLAEFTPVFKKVHETGLIDLTFDGKTVPVLIHNVQFNPRTMAPVHADFFKVNLKEKISASIPVIAIGEALAVVDKKGALMQPIIELEVEALPTDLPEKIEVSVESLAEVGDQITVEQIQAPINVTILAEPGQVVFKIDELVSKEAEEQASEEAAVAEAAAGETEATQVAGNSESTESPEEKTPEEKQA